MKKGLVYSNAAHYGQPEVKCSVLRGGGSKNPSAAEVLSSCEGLVAVVVTTEGGGRIIWSFGTFSAELNITVFETMADAKAARRILTHNWWDEYTAVELKLIDNNFITDYSRGFYRKP